MKNKILSKTCEIRFSFYNFLIFIQYDVISISAQFTYLYALKTHMLLKTLFHILHTLNHCWIWIE